jgi:hypothetical protein
MMLKKYFSAILGQVVYDINKDGFDDIIVLGDVCSYNDTTKVSTRLSSGFGVFLNNSGKNFTFSNGIDTHVGESVRKLNTKYNVAEVRVDIGQPNLIDYNSDGKFTNLAPGTYRATVKVFNGNIAELEVTILDGKITLYRGLKLKPADILNY